FLFAGGPYELTRVVMYATCLRGRTLNCAPGELSLTR
ncbi:ABC transporter permease, partial [Pseudomonas syringae pv. tagetis]